MISAKIQCPPFQEDMRSKQRVFMTRIEDD